MMLRCSGLKHHWHASRYCTVFVLHKRYGWWSPPRDRRPSSRSAKNATVRNGPCSTGTAGFQRLSDLPALYTTIATKRSKMKRTNFSNSRKNQESFAQWIICTASQSVDYQTTDSSPPSAAFSRNQLIPRTKPTSFSPTNERAASIASMKTTAPSSRPKNTAPSLTTKTETSFHSPKMRPPNYVSRTAGLKLDTYLKHLILILTNLSTNDPNPPPPVHTSIHYQLHYVTTWNSRAPLATSHNKC